MRHSLRRGQWSCEWAWPELWAWRRCRWLIDKNQNIPRKTHEIRVVSAMEIATNLELAKNGQDLFSWGL